MSTVLVQDNQLWFCLKKKPRINTVRVNCVHDFSELFEASKYSKNLPTMQFNVKPNPRVCHIYRVTSPQERWNGLGDVVCRTATLLSRFSLILNFKQFVIFVSDKKFNKKIEECNLNYKNNMDASNLWFLLKIKLQAIVM